MSRGKQAKCKVLYEPLTADLKQVLEVCLLTVGRRENMHALTLDFNILLYLKNKKTHSTVSVYTGCSLQCTRAKAHESNTKMYGRSPCDI